MDNPTFHLEGVVKARGETQDFEGPLSLILMLLQKNKIEIRDVSIGDICDQYLDYLERMERMDLEVASEFVQMAAYLLYIKTGTLLKSEREETELEGLMSSLEQLKCKELRGALAEVTPWLAERSKEGFLLLTRAPEPLPKRHEYDYKHAPEELLKALYGAFSRGDSRLPAPPALGAIAPSRIVYSVRAKSRDVLNILSRGDMSLRELYALGRSRSEVVATFISILELCSLGSVVIEEREDGLYAVFAGGDTEEILESIEE